MTTDEANAMLREAVASHAEAHGVAEAGTLLSDCVIIAAWVPTDGPARTYYTTQFPSDYMPTHTMVGLLEVGLDRAMDLSEGDDD